MSQETFPRRCVKQNERISYNGRCAKPREIRCGSEKGADQLTTCFSTNIKKEVCKLIYSSVDEKLISDIIKSENKLHSNSLRGAIDG